ncbi:MAG TPA: AAA family ATPase [Epulopiscium sp.]|nr:AAA family ATPase [Candidatus Epulonipiscium sp.]
MDVENHLIFIKSEDKTEQKKYCEYLDGKWKVRYYNSNKAYTYNHIDIVWYKNPTIIDPETHILYHHNEPVSGVIKIIDFIYYLRIIFKNGYKKVYKKSSIVIEETCSGNKAATNCFDYLKRLADYNNFLRRQYDKILTISPRSVLAAYLEKKPLAKQEDSAVQPIFPFGFNLSQKEATKKALSNQLSVIEGPPGTGKTQTILNIIANAIIHNQTVAVVSNNNSATANVFEKLQKYDVDFVGAYLGNKDNKERFFAEQTGEYPNMASWELPDIEIKKIQENLLASGQKLDQMLAYKNRHALLKQELAALQIEREYFKQYNIQPDMKWPKFTSFLPISAETVLAIILRYQRNVKNGRMTLGGKLFNLFAYGIYNFKFYRNRPEEIVCSLQQMYYHKKCQELEDEIDQLSSRLSDYHFDREIKIASENAMKVFKAVLGKRFNPNPSRPLFSEDIIWKNTTAFVKEYPVILSTAHSLRSCASENFMFDYVIIDEASQVDLVTGALALSCAKNAVIVGDLKQLPNVITSEVRQITDQIFQSYQLHKAYNYADHSLLSSCINLYDDIPTTLLKEHYRCHPKIIGFCNQKFYNNELIILTDEKANDQPLLVYKTVKGNHARGNCNQRQIDIIFEEIMPHQKIDEAVQSVGIISPYRLQMSIADEKSQVSGDLSHQVRKMKPLSAEDEATQCGQKSH